MTEAAPTATDATRTPRPVFVSFSSRNQKKALTICEALERRGIPCWISCRDTRPGANYQSSIVRAIEAARAMVLVFSRAANSSDEIKKELSLASRERLSVIAVRIENVQPTDAFAYELSTRQWIDAFSRWDEAMDAVAETLNDVATDRSKSLPRAFISRRFMTFATAGLLLVAAAFAAWFWSRPNQTSGTALQVRLAGFQRLSDDLPATLPDAVREELIGAFGEDSIVRLSTAPAPPAGSGPAYALSGTVRREGGQVKMMLRLNNERTGTTLWTRDFVRDAAQLDKLPRRAAVETSMTVRCGLFGASTYRDALPETSLGDYLQYCEHAGDEPDKALDFARKVVAAVPDFSWGWSAIEIAAFNAILQRPPPDKAEQYRAEALRAADKAIALDGANSEAYAFKSHLIPEAQLAERERLLQHALRARALPCGCEHHFYGDFLMETGRLNDAVAQYRRAIDIMALNADSQLSLAQAYFTLKRPDLAHQNLAAAFALNDDPAFTNQIRVSLAPATGDYSEAARLLNDREHGAPPPIRPALTGAFAALASRDPAAKALAVTALKSLPARAHGGLYISLLSALGAQRDALDGVLTAAADPGRAGVRSWLFTLPTAAALHDPAFSTVARRLGLLDYWKSTHTRPDVCGDAPQPAFCKAI